MLSSVSCRLLSWLCWHSCLGCDLDLDFSSALVLLGNRGDGALQFTLGFIQLPHLVYSMTQWLWLQLTGENRSAFSICRDVCDSSTKWTYSQTGARPVCDNCLQVMKWIIHKITSELAIKPFQVYGVPFVLWVVRIDRLWSCCPQGKDFRLLLIFWTMWQFVKLSFWDGIIIIKF